MNPNLFISFSARHLLSDLNRILVQVSQQGRPMVKSPLHEMVFHVQGNCCLVTLPATTCPQHFFACPPPPLQSFQIRENYLKNVHPEKVIQVY